MSRVRVYWNATRKDWSIMQNVNGKWRVIDHRIRLRLVDATFHVSAAGRERVRRTGRKSVHAWVEGTLLEASFWDGVLAGQGIIYSPWAAERFQTLMGEWVNDAPLVEFSTFTRINGKRYANVVAPVINTKG